MGSGALPLVELLSQEFNVRPEKVCDDAKSMPFTDPLDLHLGQSLFPAL